MANTCSCYNENPCWLDYVQQDGTGLNVDGSTTGTGQVIDTVAETPTNLSYTGISLIKVTHVEGTQATYQIEFPVVKTSSGYATSYKL